MHDPSVGQSIDKMLAKPLQTSSFDCNAARASDCSSRRNWYWQITGTAMNNSISDIDMELSLFIACG